MKTKSPKEGTVAQNGHFRKCELAQGRDYCWCAVRRYAAVLAISLVIFLTEILGGIFSHSLALSSDAWHVFCDKLAIGLAILAEYLAVKYRKTAAGAEKIRRATAYGMIFLLFVIALGIAGESLGRMRHPVEISGFVMMAVAAFGAALNFLQNFILKRSGETGKRDDVRKNVSIHVLSDMWQSIAVVLAAILVAWTHRPIIDPLLSLAIAALMFFWGAKLLWASLKKDFCQFHSH